MCAALSSLLEFVIPIYIDPFLSLILVCRLRSFYVGGRPGDTALPASGARGGRPQIHPAVHRGYGAAQGIFAVESAVNELAEQLGMNPTVIRDKNMVREGMVMDVYYGETANAL